MLSTPFICCSSGVATDCSIAMASAPVYVVDAMICGGMIDGNCATGSPFIATRPPMIVMIEMTIATIGRAMKNRDTGYLAPADEADAGVDAGDTAAAAIGFGSTTAPGRTFCVP